MKLFSDHFCLLNRFSSKKLKRRAQLLKGIQFPNSTLRAQLPRDQVVVPLGKNKKILQQ
jgi:hypothetical protein